MNEIVGTSAWLSQWMAWLLYVDVTYSMSGLLLLIYSRLVTLWIGRRLDCQHRGLLRCFPVSLVAGCGYKVSLWWRVQVSPQVLEVAPFQQHKSLGLVDAYQGGRQRHRKGDGQVGWCNWQDRKGRPWMQASIGKRVTMVSKGQRWMQ